MKVRIYGDVDWSPKCEPRWSIVVVEAVNLSGQAVHITDVGWFEPREPERLNRFDYPGLNERLPRKLERWEMLREGALEDDVLPESRRMGGWVRLTTGQVFRAEPVRI